MRHRIKRADWVRVKGHRSIGFVIRVARDGSWADVRWRLGTEEWSKRMRTRVLVVEHTIGVDFGDGLKGTATDWTRKQEMARAGEGA